MRVEICCKRYAVSAKYLPIEIETQNPAIESKGPREELLYLGAWPWRISDRETLVSCRGLGTMHMSRQENLLERLYTTLAARTNE